ncbi:hypothetical protein EMIT0324P_11573 [Pseudomonas chlororaphis]
MLAMNLRAPRLFRKYASSLTSIAGKPRSYRQPLCSRCRRLRSRPKGAQGLKIAEGLRPYRSLRQRLQVITSDSGRTLKCALHWTPTCTATCHWAR